MFPDDETNGSPVGLIRIPANRSDFYRGSVAIFNALGLSRGPFQIVIAFSSDPVPLNPPISVISSAETCTDLQGKNISSPDRNLWRITSRVDASRSPWVRSGDAGLPFSRYFQILSHTHDCAEYDPERKCPRLPRDSSHPSQCSIQNPAQENPPPLLLDPLRDLTPQGKHPFDGSQKLERLAGRTLHEVRILLSRRNCVK